MIQILRKKVTIHHTKIFITKVLWKRQSNYNNFLLKEILNYFKQ
jgi:hypothetical protein